MLLRVASGEQTKSEVLGLGDNEFMPWQVGTVMQATPAPSPTGDRCRSNRRCP